MSFSFGGFGAAPASSAAASTGFSFGAAPASSAAASTGFSFGATPAASAPASTGFSFGAAPASSAASTGGFSFGAAPASSAASTGGFSFGAAPASSAASTGGFSFGAAPASSAAASTGFSFGAAPASSAAASTGFSFGAAPAASTPATSTGFSFGAAPASSAAASTGFSFGATATPAQPATTSGFGTFSFGSPAPAAGVPASTGFSFGAPAAGAANTGFGFGAQAAPAAAPAAGQQPMITGAIPQATAHIPLGDPILAKINNISRMYDHGSSECRFQTVLYNRVHPIYRSKLAKPPHANEQVWRNGVENNPDPQNLAPCLVVGFNDLNARISEQHKALQAHDNLLNDVSTKVKQIREGQSQCHAKLQRARSQQLQLHHRVMALMNKLATFRAQSFPLMVTEQEYLHKLKLLQQELNKPGHYLSKLHELQSMLVMQGQAEGKDANENVVVDSETIKKLQEALDLQRQYILELTQTLSNDQQDVTNIVDALNDTSS